MNKVSIVFLLLINMAYANINIQTSTKQNTMIELFSSEGCSSCPPAEKWMNKFKHDKELWTKYIPIVYHVDYWDYIGWNDKFAKAKYSIKQRKYAKNSHTSGVYTPGFLINSKEWRDWFGLKYISHSKKTTNILSLKVINNDIEVKYNQEHNKYDVHIALLGFGFKSKIRHGENSGEILEHDFVVLKEKVFELNNSILNTKLFSSKIKAKRYALAVWLVKKGTMNIVQSTGGWL